MRSASLDLLLSSVLVLILAPATFAAPRARVPTRASAGVGAGVGVGVGAPESVAASAIAGVPDFAAERAWIDRLEPWSAVQAEEIRGRALNEHYRELRAALERTSRRSTDVGWARAAAPTSELAQEATVLALRENVLSRLVPMIGDEIEATRERAAVFRARLNATASRGLAACDSRLRDIERFSERLGQVPGDALRSLEATQTARLASSGGRIFEAFRELHRAVASRAMIEGERELAASADFRLPGGIDALLADESDRGRVSLAKLDAESTELAALSKTFTPFASFAVRPDPARAPSASHGTGEAPHLRCHYAAPAESSDRAQRAPAAGPPALPPAPPPSVGSPSTESPDVIAPREGGAPAAERAI